MKKQFFAVVVVPAVLFAFSVVPAIAGNNAPAADPITQNFEQTRADTLKRLDDRITLLTNARACVQAAGMQTDLLTCRKKYRDVLQAPPKGK